MHGKRTRHKHGMAGTPEYVIWESMRARCSNPNRPHYERYGGRGITVCEAWADFSRFYADMGTRPSPKHTIDRIDNDGPYSPENCRWATRSEQQRNRADSVRLTYQGRTMALADWADQLGVDRKTLDSRRRDGLPIESVLNPSRLPIGRPPGQR